MPTVIATATEDEMIATFLRAESGSSRFRTVLQQSLEQHGFTLRPYRITRHNRRSSESHASGATHNISWLG